MTRVNKILVFIPVLFIILRVWATVQYFFSVYVSRYHAIDNGRCIPAGLKVVHVILGVLQVRGLKLIKNIREKDFGGCVL